MTSNDRFICEFEVKIQTMCRKAQLIG